VARIYAGILGPLAFLTSLARGIVHGGSSQTVLETAWCCLLGFAAAGYVIGRLAEWTIIESVHGRLAAELAARQDAAGSKPAAAKP
jgi:hypothetical protein